MGLCHLNHRRIQVVTLFLYFFLILCVCLFSPLLSLGLWVCGFVVGDYSHFLLHNLIDLLPHIQHRYLFLDYEKQMINYGVLFSRKLSVDLFAPILKVKCAYFNRQKRICVVVTVQCKVSVQKVLAYSLMSLITTTESFSNLK